jgi:hypothetical protein
VKRNPIAALMLGCMLIALAGGAYIFQTTVAGRVAAARKVANSRSELRLAMVVTHTSGPIGEEDYRMTDLDGVSSSSYRAVGRSGTAITVESLPRETYDVSFFFEKTVQDGIWELQNRPTRGDDSTAYDLWVYQLVNGQHGSHRFHFTDPQYWATSGGHQFHIKLDKNKPVPNLLTLSSTVVVEPRYAKVVDDFRSFGTDSFRAKIVAARTRLGGRS